MLQAVNNTGFFTETDAIFYVRRAAAVQCTFIPNHMKLYQHLLKPSLILLFSMKCDDFSLINHCYLLHPSMSLFSIPFTFMKTNGNH